MKVGDEVLVIGAIGEEAMPELVGCVGEIIEVYPAPFVFEFLVHFAAHRDEESYSFNKEELEVI